jgi:hypothetical protein
MRKVVLSSSSLSPLIRHPMHKVLLQSSQALLDILEGVGIGEAQVAFAMGTKIDARGHRDLGML